MTAEESRPDDRGARDSSPNGSATADWPVPLSGVTETVVATRGPNGLWNFAALGVFAPDGETCDEDHAGDDGPAANDASDGGRAANEYVTARTWGRTRTRGNFHRRGEGYVQFVDDPVVFADAALSIVEREEPLLESASAWVRVAVDPLESGTDAGTEWEEWALRLLESAVESTRVPTVDRGFGAVVEATVAASRLGVAGYDDDELRERLAYCASVVDRAGGPREREALERVREHAEW
ncbi:DUF447 domain-containing protein [Haloterrigena alkaliphila]|uniref:DUF447 family protein n=1 Tax=Haloterrigena alkaliphila TaxID=2816475 RepID=A0A8A2VDW3_9EURY|nr:DUF447 domain-containing protein [Haloterrigena alkaliphila]QSW98900.1 DUF447 family protein [Haloterrigena alkaliphila]